MVSTHKADEADVKQWDTKVWPNGPGTVDDLKVPATALAAGTLCHELGTEGVGPVVKTYPQGYDLDTLMKEISHQNPLTDQRLALFNRERAKRGLPPFSIIPDQDARTDGRSVKTSVVVSDEEMAEANELIERWIKSQESMGRPVLQKNDLSRTHKLVECSLQAHIVSDQKTRGKSHVELDSHVHINHEHIFVAQHDWAGVIGTDALKAASVVLPFDNCTFEYRISNQSVIVLANTLSSGHVILTAMVEMPGGKWWAALECENTPYPLVEYAKQQTLACCVVMEAEVAGHEVVRAPAALNKKRKEQGKLPLYDFHIIDLSKKRSPITNKRPPDPDREVTRRRLHFVIGHWRNYADHRTRIPWHLRGDPELGFVDKLYKL